MNSGINELANAVFKKALHECNVEELQQLAEQYPYFGPAHLLLAKKLSAASFDEESSRVQYDEQVQKASLYFQNRVWLHHLLNEAAGLNETAVAPLAKDENETVAANDEQSSSAAMIQNETRVPELSPEVADESIEPEHRNEMMPSANQTPVELQTDAMREVPENLPAGDETKIENAVKASPEAPQVAPNDNMVFEPFHTVDYFASQGIKFRDEERPKDRLGMQLKSFTEWLKTLKQVNVADLAKSMDSNAEKKVEQMAEFSIAERHIVTEAMAEVWIKQGNTARAEEIYRKLSLLDPSKSSYFAAKIDELKKTS